MHRTQILNLIEYYALIMFKLDKLNLIFCTRVKNLKFYVHYKG